MKTGKQSRKHPLLKEIDRIMKLKGLHYSKALLQLCIEKPALYESYLRWLRRPRRGDHRG